jgi:hypothetical protein
MAVPGLDPRIVAVAAVEIRRRAPRNDDGGSL